MRPVEYRQTNRHREKEKNTPKFRHETEFPSWDRPNSVMRPAEYRQTNRHREKKRNTPKFRHETEFPSWDRPYYYYYACFCPDLALNSQSASRTRFDCSQDNEFVQSPYWFLLFDSSFPGYDGYAEQAQVHKLLYRVGYGWVGGFQIITSCSR